MNHDLLISKVFYTTRIRKTIISKFEANLDKYPNIVHYLKNRYTRFFTFRETIFRIYNKLDNPKLCSYCGIEIPYTTASEYCSKEHRILGRKINVEKSCYEKYGVSNVAKLQEVKDKMVAHTDYNARNEKSRKSMLEKYGVDNPGKMKSTIEASHTKEVIEKQKISREKTNLERYGKRNSMQSDVSKESYKRTCNKQWGKDNYFQTDEFKAKVDWKRNVKKQQETKRKNGTFNISKEEEICHKLLLEYYPDVVSQYKSDKYNFLCDFYIPSIDTYIEYNGTWTHGNHPFDPNSKDDVALVEKWKTMNTLYYNNAIRNWTEYDVLKRTIAQENNLNYFEFWNIKDVYKWLGKDLTDNHLNTLFIEYDKDCFLRELEFYKEKQGSLNVQYRNSQIIKHYQQNVFYKTELELWKDNNIRQKLTENRLQYLGKSLEDLTVEDILDGFKISGIHYGYSSHNPRWIKWFIEHYNIKSCYDPCGGWGHRLLGAISSSLNSYIYNDLSTETYENVNRIIKDFKIKNVKAYNNDANSFIPSEEFDAIFTSPPYYNTEIYPCGQFVSMEEYDKLIDNIFDVFYRKESCKVMGLVLREDCLPEKYKEKSLEPKCLSRTHKTHLSKSPIKYKEYLYIFKK